MEARGRCGVSLITWVFSTLFLRQSLLQNLELTVLARCLAGKPWESSCLCLPSGKGIGMCCHAWLTQVLRTELMCVWQALYQLSSLFNPHDMSLVMKIPSV